ncbi:hypothetical protein YC2023_008846 [Brassica napus]
MEYKESNSRNVKRIYETHSVQKLDLNKLPMEEELQSSAEDEKFGESSGFFYDDQDDALHPASRNSKIIGSKSCRLRNSCKKNDHIESPIKLETKDNI